MTEIDDELMAQLAARHFQDALAWGSYAKKSADEGTDAVDIGIFSFVGGVIAHRTGDKFFEGDFPEEMVGEVENEFRPQINKYLPAYLALAYSGGVDTAAEMMYSAGLYMAAAIDKAVMAVERSD